MKTRTTVLVAMLLTLVLTAFAPATPTLAGSLRQDATATPEADEEAVAEEGEGVMEEELQLVTATAFADLVRPGRVLMSARANHWVYDSVPPINGPNEEVNPLDGMLGALVSCGLYIYEAVAAENHIPFNHASGTATGELDPRGVAGADVNPPRTRLQPDDECRRPRRRTGGNDGRGRCGALSDLHYAQSLGADHGYEYRLRPGARADHD